MKLTKYSLLIIAVLFSVSSALTLTIDPTSVQTSVVADIDSYYCSGGSYPGTITFRIMDVTSNVLIQTKLYARIDSAPQNQDNLDYRLPEDSLQWNVYWASTDGTFGTDIDTSSSSGVGNDHWVPYRVATDDYLLSVNSSASSKPMGAKIDLGTKILRIPAVQPSGVYKSAITYTVVEE